MMSYRRQYTIDVELKAELELPGDMVDDSPGAEPPYIYAELSDALDHHFRTREELVEWICDYATIKSIRRSGVLEP